jgi:hypothetical protein
MKANDNDIDYFKSLLAVFSAEHKLHVDKYCSRRLLSFYTHDFKPLMLHKMDIDIVAPLVLKPFKAFNVERLVKKAKIIFDEFVDERLEGFMLPDFYDTFETHTIQSVVLKKDYTSLLDVAYYQVELISDTKPTRIFINLHTEPVTPSYRRDSNKRGSIKYIIADVYYKDMESIKEPMLAYYLTEVSAFLQIPVTDMDENVLTLIKMAKI